jgi:hypothetical protein
VILTVVVLICHQLAGISAPICHEEIVTKAEMPMQACMIFQPAIADWKEKSIYRGEQWTIARVRCVPGDYELRDAT